MGKDYATDMHTAEHVLNGVMVATFGCGRCFSAHINPKKSKCDYHFDGVFSDAEARLVEERVNAILQSGQPVVETFLSREEAAVRFDLTRLPADAGETVRVISVGEHDACPCIDPHVANTLEVGTLRIISHDLNDGVLRLRFRLDAAS